MERKAAACLCDRTAIRTHFESTPVFIAVESDNRDTDNRIQVVAQIKQISARRIQELPLRSVSNWYAVGAGLGVTCTIPGEKRGKVGQVIRSYMPDRDYGLCCWKIKGIQSWDERQRATEIFLRPITFQFLRYFGRGLLAGLLVVLNVPSQLPEPRILSLGEHLLLLVTRGASVYVAFSLHSFSIISLTLVMSYIRRCCQLLGRNIVLLKTHQGHPREQISVQYLGLSRRILDVC